MHLNVTFVRTLPPPPDAIWLKFRINLLASPACYVPNSVDVHKIGSVTGGMEKLLNRINNFHFSPKILWLFLSRIAGHVPCEYIRSVLCSVFQKHTEQ